MNSDLETAVSFGPGHRLLGILNHRRSDAGRACLLMNVGVTHRIGPRRLNVKLARALGLAGFTSLRFDLSGIGDSAHAPYSGGYEGQAESDIAAAMDAVEAATGIREFVLLGICSGAVNSYRVAQRDPRVVGLMMFDGYAFPNLKSKLVHDWTRLKSTPARALVKKIWLRVQRVFGMAAAEPAVSIFFASSDALAPDRTAFGDAMDALVRRGVDVFVLFSASLLSLHNYDGQFRDVFRGRAFIDHVRCRYAPEFDHIPTSQAAQRAFLAEVVGWVEACRAGRRQAAGPVPQAVSGSVPGGSKRSIEQ